MELKTLLRQLPSLEGRTFEFDGETFNMPYHTLQYNGQLIQGLRENVKRIRMLHRIIDSFGVLDMEHTSLLDIGCNLGTIGASLLDIFQTVVGIDEYKPILDLAENVYTDPELNFIRFPLNEKRLPQMFSPQEFNVTLCLSMLEYVNDKPEFITDLHDITRDICIVEGHSMDIPNGMDVFYDGMLRCQDWKVVRLPELTDAGLNAPSESPGRPIWVCSKRG